MEDTVSEVEMWKTLSQMVEVRKTRLRRWKCGSTVSDGGSVEDTVSEGGNVEDTGGNAEDTYCLRRLKCGRHCLRWWKQHKFVSCVGEQAFTVFNPGVICVLFVV